MAQVYDRDLIGYGPNPPDPKWPNGARLAVNFVMNYEEGSEPSVQDGEGYSETGLTESHGVNQGVKGRDLAAETMFEYGSRVGFWRLMRLCFAITGPDSVDDARMRLRQARHARGPVGNGSAAQGSLNPAACHGKRWSSGWEGERPDATRGPDVATMPFKVHGAGRYCLGLFRRKEPSANRQCSVTPN